MDELSAAPAQPVVVSISEDVLGAYKKMLLIQFGATVGLVAVFAASLWLSFHSASNSPPLLPLIVGAGILGALFSALTRLYNVDHAGVALITPTIKALGGGYILMYSLVPPLIGAIAAVVLYLVFVAKFLSGGLFPQIDCVEGRTCKDILELMLNYWPSKPEDYGKALVWSFVAGFSERLVPDVLQSLVVRASPDGEH
jgi:hypothetical protein